MSSFDRFTTRKDGATANGATANGATLETLPSPTGANTSTRRRQPPDIRLIPAPTCQVNPGLVTVIRGLNFYDDHFKLKSLSRHERLIFIDKMRRLICDNHF